MSDTISYKKPIKIRNDLNSQRRNALKDFYKLQSKQKAELGQTPDLQEHEPEIFTEPPDSLSDNELSKFIQESSIAQILRKENEVVTELNSNQAEIKSIIYNNYYELIKLNQILINLNDEGEQNNESKIDMTKAFDEIKASISIFDEFDQSFPDTIEDTTDSESLASSISALISQDKITAQTADQIQTLLSKLKYGEHDVLILQLNESKQKIRR